MIVTRHKQTGKFRVYVGKRYRTLNWKPSQGKAALVKEVRAAVKSMPLDAKTKAALTLVVVKAAVTAFLAWWTTRGPGSPKGKGKAKPKAKAKRGKSKRKRKSKS